jgi:hypothetical protein
MSTSNSLCNINAGVRYGTDLFAFLAPEHDQELTHARRPVSSGSPQLSFCTYVSWACPGRVSPYLSQASVSEGSEYK